jgi:HK97 gp10 family phage protein
MDKLLAQLKELEAELAVKALATAARKAFKPVLDAAKAMVPRHSGALADAIKLRVERPSAGDTVVRVGLMIGSSRLAKQAQVAAAAFGEAQSTELPPARRWHFVELGTAHQAAHPYLRPALDHNASAVLDILRVELDAAIKKVAR